jgi:hypothetical protein
VVWHALAYRADKFGLCFVSVQRILADTSLKRPQTIWRALNELEASKLLSRRPLYASNGRQTVNLFSLAFAIGELPKSVASKLSGRGWKMGQARKVVRKTHLLLVREAHPSTQCASRTPASSTPSAPQNSSLNLELTQGKGNRQVPSSAAIPFRADDNSRKSPLEKSEDLRFERWARARINDRATTPISDQAAYFSTSLTNLKKNIRSEVTKWLAKCAVDYLSFNPLISEGDLVEFLKGDAGVDCLPYDSGVIESAIRRARGILAEATEASNLRTAGENPQPRRAVVQ